MFCPVRQDSYHVGMTGVKVIAICPGATETGLIGDIKKQLLSPDYERAWQRDTINSNPQKWVLNFFLFLFSIYFNHFLTRYYFFFLNFQARACSQIVNISATKSAKRICLARSERGTPKRDSLEFKLKKKKKKRQGYY